MSTVSDDDLAALRDSLRSFLARYSGEPAVRRAMATQQGWDPDLWQRLTTELGLQALAIPEEHGGQGFGWQELGIASEEAGRALLCAPFFATACLSVPLLLGCAPDAREEYLPQIAAGTLTATVAGIAPSTVTAVPKAGGWRLSGTAPHVVDGHTAGLVLVAASTGDGTAVFAAGGAAPGLHREPLGTLDLTRKQARLTFNDVPATLASPPGAAAGALERALDHARIALAAEQVGGTGAVVEMAVGYAKTRHQFGRPIGSFQSVKHACADMLLSLESARVLKDLAVQSAAKDTDLPLAASMSKAYCSDAYAACSAQNIQIHGAIAFTWEHPAHLHLRRAKTSAIMLGTPDHHRDRLLTQAGL